MIIYKIADLIFNVETKNEYLINRMKPFEIEINQAPDLLVNMAAVEYFKKPVNEKEKDKEGLIWDKNEKNSGYSGYYKANNKIIVIFYANEFWDNVKIEYINCQSESESVEYTVFHLLGFIFFNRIIYFSGIILHAAAIKYNNLGILFTAPSGTGKSTQASLWKEQFSESVVKINDDTPALRIVGNKIYIYGTPWSGSSDEFSIIKTELSVLLIVNQAKNNRLEEMSIIQGIEDIVPRAFMPYHNKVMTEKAFDIIEKILTKIPLYNLYCTPEKEAVETVCKELNNKGFYNN